MTPSAGRRHVYQNRVVKVLGTSMCKWFAKLAEVVEHSPSLVSTHLTHRFFVAVVVLAAAAGEAPAQVYRCQSGRTVYYSRTPCSATSPSQAQPNHRLGAFGPAPTAARAAQSRSMPVYSATKPSPHARYLSPACASLDEAIRTGYSRGASIQNVLALREEYAAKCSAEDREALKQQGEAQYREAELHATQREQELANKHRQQADAEQCFGMRDTAAVRRKREQAGQLSAQEIESLRKLELAYKDRCLASQH